MKRNLKIHTKSEMELAMDKNVLYIINVMIINSNQRTHFQVTCEKMFYIIYNTLYIVNIEHIISATEYTVQPSPLPKENEIFDI